MPATADSDRDLSALRDDVAILKSEVAKLIERLAGRAPVRDHRVAAEAATGVRGFAQCAVGQSERSAEAVALWVVRQPLLALVIGVTVGYVAARALSR
jgi:hypothetical protein